MNINIEHLSFRYTKCAKPVLNNIDLQIKSGTINVLLGLNGSGKTTLMRLLSGFEIPETGSITYGTEALEKMSIHKRSKFFSFVQQYSTVREDIPVYDYLTYGFTNRLRLWQEPGQAEHKEVVSISEKLEISDFLNRFIGELSGGEKQKIMVAAALIQNTPVVLLDEPTSALDMKNQYSLLSLLKNISEDSRTIVFSSHNPNHALFLDANVILLNDGNVIAAGRASDIIKPENLYPIYGEHICYSSELAYKEISYKR